MRNFDTAVWDREKQNAALSGKYAKFTQNPAMKLHLLSTGNKCLAEASPLDPVWGIGLLVDDPRAKDPHKWRGKNLLGEALPAVREAIRDSEAGSPHPASPSSIPKPHRSCWNPRNLFRSRAWGPQSALTKALLRPTFQVHPPIKPWRFWR